MVEEKMSDENNQKKLMMILHVKNIKPKMVKILKNKLQQVRKGFISK